LDEVELVVSEGPEELTLFIEIDRRGGLLSELAETDESKTSLTVRDADVDSVRDELERTISKFA
jgi:sporulation-control protein